MLKPEPMKASDGAYLRIAFVAGSMLYRYAFVLCDALKKRPPFVHSTIDGFSSNAVLMYSILPPAAGTIAMPLLRNEYAFDIADPNAIVFPSGDHTGPPSAPGCVTSGRTLPSATETTEMSAVSPLVFAVLMRWSNAISRPSGDQLNAPIVNV